MDNHFGDWSIDQKVYAWILSDLPCGSTILELGSGWASGELARHYEVYSVENSSDFYDKYERVHYIKAPHIGGWYDRDILVNELPKKYDLFLIDGPQANHRHKVIENQDLFNWNVPVLIDDYQESGLAAISDHIAAHICKRQSEIIYGATKMCMVVK